MQPDITLPTINDSNYTAYPNMDCNFDDLQKAPCASTHTCTVQLLEQDCNNLGNCIGFNLPGAILKSACDNWKSVPTGTSTFYFKPGHGPPPVRSSCRNGFCIPDPNGTFAGTDCNNTCPAITPLPQLLSDFAVVWQNSTWDPTQLPATPTGDPVAMARALLAKYPSP